MKNQIIDFDHELSCVVGKNGTGKSSIVDFLRETFFILLKLINDANIRCESGCITEEEYRDYDILDEAAQFLVVFKFDETPYFLTNIKGTTIMLALRDEKKQKLDRQDERLDVDYRKVIEDYFGEESDYYAGFKILIDQIGEVIYREI